MKKIVLTATALLVLAGSAPAITVHNTFNGKTKTSTPTTEPGPSTSVIPGCPKSDPDGCGINEGIPPR